MDANSRNLSVDYCVRAADLRAVLFDFQGVISRRGSKGKGRELTAMLERDLGLAPGSLERLLGEHDLKAIYRDERDGTTTRAEAIERELARRLGRRIDLRDWLLKRTRSRLIQANLDVVRALRPRYKTAVLANSSGRLRRRMRWLGIDALFDDVVDSGEVGIAKPDERIYALAAARLGCAPGQCLFIDDKPENVVGAVRAGMQGVYYSYEDGDDLPALLAARGLPLTDEAAAAV